MFRALARKLFLDFFKAQNPFFLAPKIDVFAYPRGGRDTCVFWRGTSAIFLPKEKISTCVREIGAAAAAYSPLPSFFFPAFGWHGRSGSLPEDNTQVGELARFQSIMNERNHKQTKSLVVGMDRKPAAKPAEAAPRPPATPAVTRTQTVDVRASKAQL